MDQWTSQWYGETPFTTSLNIQLQHAHLARKSTRGFVLGFEHPKVITLGKRGDPKVDLQLSTEEIHSKNIEIHSIDRGGQATIHNPGQLVIYPVVNIKTLGWGVKEYVERLLKTTSHTLTQVGVPLEPHCESGLFTELGKITFVGVRIEGGVTRHGLSINVNNDLTEFSWIRSCGVLSARMDSVSRYSDISTHLLFEKWCENWWSLLGSNQ